MHCDDRFGPRRNARGYVGRADLPGCHIRLGEDGCGTDIADGVHRGYVGERRDDDLVARPES